MIARIDVSRSWPFLKSAIFTKSWFSSCQRCFVIDHVFVIVFLCSFASHSLLMIADQNSLIEFRIFGAPKSSTFALASIANVIDLKMIKIHWYLFFTYFLKKVTYSTIGLHICIITWFPAFARKIGIWYTQISTAGIAIKFAISSFVIVPSPN